MARTRSKRIVARLGAAVGLGGIAAMGAVTFSAANGCTDTRCEPTVPAPNFGYTAADGGQKGVVVTENVWASNEVFEPWLNFSHATPVYFHLPERFHGRNIASIIPYVSPYAVPQDVDAALASYTIASGNLAVIVMLKETPNAFSVLNDTCADYFLRVVVTFESGPAAPPISPDSGFVADATADANGDSATDAGDATGDASGADSTSSDAAAE